MGLVQDHVLLAEVLDRRLEMRRIDVDLSDFLQVSEGLEDLGTCGDLGKDRCLEGGSGGGHWLVVMSGSYSYVRELYA